MTKKSIKHVRQHAKKHHQAHQNLKKAVNKPIYRESVFKLFATTFLIALASVIIFINWGNIVNQFKEINTRKSAPTQAEEIETNAYKDGIEFGYLINGQTINETIKKGIEAEEQGSQTDIKFLKDNETEDAEEKKATPSKNTQLMNSIVFSSSLGNGDHLTNGRSSAGNSLQKSIVTSYYLGQNSLGVNSILAKDLELLSKINNALAVNVFAYLNQSSNRADSLDNYLKLLETLNKTGQEQSIEIESQVNSLTSNFEAKERAITLKEEVFFRTIGAFDGRRADEELKAFIQLQKDQTETRAKIGAYQSIKDYYDFFLPNIDLLIRSINANRDPLIAGVRVVEIENMQLELIIEE